MNSLFVEDGSKLESTIDFSRLLKAIKNNWWKIAIFSVVVTLLSIPLILKLTPKYESYASLLLKSELTNSTEFEKTVNFDSTRARYFDTQYELLKSRRVAIQVVENLKLYETPEFIGGLNINADNIDERKKRSIKYVYDNMNILPVRNTQLVSIGFESKSAENAANVANEIVKVFIDFSIENNEKTNAKVINFLQQQVNDMHSVLKKKEDGLNDFLKKENLIDFYGVDGYQSKQLSLLTEDLATARTQRVSLESLYNTVLKYQKEDLSKLMAIPDISRHPNIENIIQQLTDQRALLSELKERYGPKYEKVVQAQTQLNILERQSDSLIKDIAEGIKNQYKAAEFKENQIRAEMKKHASSFHLLGVKKTQYDRMVDDIKHTRTLYNRLSQRLNETQVNNRYHESTAEAVDLALVPDRPSKPNKPLLIIAIAIMSLLIALMFVVILSALNNKVITVFDMSSRLGLNILGEIKRYNEAMTIRDALDNNVKYPSIDNASLGIRSQLLLLDTDAQVLAVSSATDKEGKSLVSSLISKAMAIDFKVLLVDLNLRDSSLTNAFECTEHRGIVNVLYEGEALHNAITKQQWFDFLPIGISQNRSPLITLTNQKLKDLFQDLRQEYDYVIVDTPAISDSKDTTLISQFVDAGILVVQSNHNPANMSVAALDKIKNIKMLGGVLNNVDEKALELTENLHLSAIEDIIL